MVTEVQHNDICYRRRSLYIVIIKEEEEEEEASSPRRCQTLTASHPEAPRASAVKGAVHHAGLDRTQADVRRDALRPTRNRRRLQRQPQRARLGLRRSRQRHKQLVMSQPWACATPAPSSSSATRRRSRDGTGPDGLDLKMRDASAQSGHADGGRTPAARCQGEERLCAWVSSRRPLRGEGLRPQIG